MPSTSLPRLAMRQSRWALQKRAASTTSNAANAASSGASKAKEGVQQAAGKAQEGLSRVSSSAGSTISNTASAAGNAVSGMGGRAGAAISFVQSLVPPTIYYARVAGELTKLMFQGRNMYPPTMQTIQSYLTPVQNALRNPSSVLNRTVNTAGAAAEKTADAAVTNPESFLTRLRNMDTAALTTVGVIGAEVIGFFSVGEMIGRFNIIGYRSSGAHAEHH